MKAIYCQECGTITSPGPGNRDPRSCSCGEYRCWWEDGQRGIFRVQHMSGHPAIPRPKPGAPWGRVRVWILGINNGLLHYEGAGTPSAEANAAMIDQIPDSYIFKSTRSHIIRIRPGQSSDTDWGELPKPKVPCTECGGSGHGPDRVDGPGAVYQGKCQRCDGSGLER